MEDELIQILRDDLLDHDGEITPETDLFEIGLDSMGIMQLLLSIEDRFGTAIDPVDLSRDNFQTATRIAALVRSKQA
ncbi:acylcarrier protein [Haloferula helveola]|uniref:Acylcarrier protein n=1 Tax=Haloferula helveola TaxID=490095 RepID=A0ABM7RBF9_9BACT|nr:acylcarrier protein [Haloferula helveola]